MGFVTVKTIRVENELVKFGENLPEGTRIYAKFTNKIYKVIESVNSGTTLE